MDMRSGEIFDATPEEAAKRGPENVLSLSDGEARVLRYYTDVADLRRCLGRLLRIVNEDTRRAWIMDELSRLVENA